MIDVNSEQLMPLSQVVRHYPGRAGKQVHFSTVLRWITTGIRTPSGRVCLEATRLGAKWLTSREAIQRFSERLSLREEGKRSPASPASRRSAEPGDHEPAECVSERLSCMPKKGGTENKASETELI